MGFELHLDDKNILPSGYDLEDYESKGLLTALLEYKNFLFVVILIRRRRLPHKQTRKEIRNDYSFIAKGSRLTQELSGFLIGKREDMISNIASH